jgi:hypothetical protein
LSTGCSKALDLELGRRLGKSLLPHFNKWLNTNS